MKRINLIALSFALLASAFTTGCEVTVTVSSEGDLEITNSIVWDDGPADLTAVHIGTSIDNALAQTSAGELPADGVMTVMDLSETETWTVIAVDSDGLWYSSTSNIVIGGLTSMITLTAADFDQALTDAQTETIVIVDPEPEPDPETGDLTVTNSVDWSGATVEFVSATVSGPSSQTVDMGIEAGFSMQGLPVGDYSVTITDNYDVIYEATEVPIEANAESMLDVMLAHATSGGIYLTNLIDNLDGDEVFVVGLYATPPDGVLVDLADQKNWLEGVELGYDSSSIAIGVLVGNYQLIVADMDDNYYTKMDIAVNAGQVTDVTVTTDDRDEDLTLALN